ncbi:unnamed protein product [Malus baccata var. baccata]
MTTFYFHCSHAKTRIPQASKFYLNDDQFSYASGSETDQVEDETEQVDKSDEATSIFEEEKLSALPDLALKNDEIDMLRAELEDKGKQLEVLVKQVRYKESAKRSGLKYFIIAQVKEKEMSLKLNQLEEELEVSKGNAEQWRKAVDAAVVVLTGGVEMNGRVIKPSTGGYIDFVRSQADDLDDGFGSNNKVSNKVLFRAFWSIFGPRLDSASMETWGLTFLKI